MSTSITSPGGTGVISPKTVDFYGSIGNSSDSKIIQKLIERRHPEYNELINCWRFFGSTYQGGRQWFEENIHKYYREGEREFSERIVRSYRFNHTKEVVDLINKYLFKQCIQRSENAPKSVKEFWKVATRGGAGIDDLAKQISKHCSIYGRVGIVVDRQKSEQKVVTVEDAQKQRVKTYAYVVNPEDMLDYSFDDEGQLNWILIRETYRDDADPLSVNNSETKERFRLWTRKEWILIAEVENKNKKTKSFDIIDGGNHDLGEVPVVLADNLLTDERYGAPALINDIAYLDKAAANYLSNLDAIIQDQTFSQLVMPAQNVMPDTDAHEQLVEMSTKRIFLYDAQGSNHSPEYISPDPRQAHLILEVVSRIIKEIYNSVGLSAERSNKDNAVSMDNSSGVAKAYDFERVNALLSAKADSLEVAENRIAKLVALWNGEESKSPEEYVQYPDNFDTRGLYDEFDIAARLMLVEAPDAIRQEQMRTIVDKLFPMIEEKIRKKIDAEIDDWPPSPEEMMAAVSRRTSQNNLGDPTSTVYKTGGKGEATTDANGSASDKKKPEATKRQGQVTKQTE